MKFGVVGPGSLGSYLAGMLSIENDVHLIGRRELDIDNIKISGLIDLDTDVDYSKDPEDLVDSDCIIICTKSYDTNEAMKEISHHIGENTYILSLQNGLDNEKIISQYVGENRVVGGVTSIGITFIEHGHVKLAGGGDTHIGIFPEGKSDFVIELADVFNSAGIKTQITDNVYGHIWKKVIINSGINPLTALTGLKNGEILESDEAHEILIKLCEESARVALEEVNLPEGDPVKETENVAELTSENRSSMLQDIENKRKTEIDCINGAVCIAGKKLGIKTPYNKTLTALVKAKEKSYL
ncbi:MAG: ketopantoate reductase family protein [Thermoplasmatota archaeon]